jgi:hypothetical protein
LGGVLIQNLKEDFSIRAEVPIFLEDNIHGLGLNCVSLNQVVIALS